MKKEYVTPCINVGIMECDESLLQSSYTNIGGKTDGFDARVRGTRETWDDFEE